uniref:Uncharacterized protein n=1 Tax=Glossina brevipalpis TaxID=37001 RepID=A0A1A9WDJ0_9MUSC
MVFVLSQHTAAILFYNGQVLHGPDISLASCSSEHLYSKNRYFFYVNQPIIMECTRNVPVITVIVKEAKLALKSVETTFSNYNSSRRINKKKIVFLRYISTRRIENNNINIILYLGSIICLTLQYDYGFS